MKTLKQIRAFFLAPMLNYDINKKIDEFVYKLIADINSGDATLSANYCTLSIRYSDGRQFNIWTANKYYAWLSRCGSGEWGNYRNLWDDESPSRLCIYEFKKCIDKHMPNWKIQIEKSDFTTSRFSGIINPRPTN